MVWWVWLNVSYMCETIASPITIWRLLNGISLHTVWGVGRGGGGREGVRRKGMGGKESEGGESRREREEGMGGDSGRERGRGREGGRERAGILQTMHTHVQCITYCTCHHTVSSPDSLLLL